MTAALAYRSQTAPVRRRSTSPKAASRPRLRVLDQAAVRRRARRRNAVLLAFIVLLAALFLVAFVHARLVESQQELDLMRTRISELQVDKAQLERAVDEASSPALIVERASALGMVRAAEPVYLASVVPPAAESTIDVVAAPLDATQQETAQPDVLGSRALGENETG
ncbi:MAG: hypothetical protein OEV40_18145 [Acidimicrobiia bacterium]|nr:hypothetical protein [Acidimicrobiia bacterium]